MILLKQKPITIMVFSMHSEGLSFNKISKIVKLDWGCVKQRYNDFIHDNKKGGEVPDPDFVVLLQKYIKALEDFEKQNPKKRYPDWATKMFKKRYNFKLIN